MVYESDFYTTRRPYRPAPSPSYSSYSSTSIVPSRQIRIYPGLGKVHVVHSYDRIIPYVGHKRLTMVTTPGPRIVRVRPSVIVRELDRIQNRVRPYHYYSPTSHWLNSEASTWYYPYTYSSYYPYYYSSYYPYYHYPRYSNYPYEPYYHKYYPSVLYNYPYYSDLWRNLYWSRLYPNYPTHVWSKMFEDETKLIRAQSHALLKRCQTHVPRVDRTWPLTTTTVRYSWFPETTWPSRVTSDDFVYRMLTPIRNVKNDIYNISHYHSEPYVRRLVGGGLACLKYGGDKAYSRRRNLTLQEIYSMQSDAVRGDIQLLSYYIKANKERKLQGDSAPLSASRPSRVFNPRKWFMECLAPDEEILELRRQREIRLARIHEVDAPLEKKERQEQQIEQRALIEEKEEHEILIKKEEVARKSELARQEALAAQAAAERQAELDRKKDEEKQRQKEAARKEAEERKAAEEEEERFFRAKEAARIAKEKEEKARLEEEAAELARLEEERQQLLRLEEIARQAEEEKEKELARQAAELAELARQEKELAEQSRREAELAELAKQEAELMELEKQERELAELDRKEREAATQAKDELDSVEQKREAAEFAAAADAVSSDDLLTSSEPESDPEPIVQEPVTPDIKPTLTESSCEEVEEEEEEEETE